MNSPWHKALAVCAGLVVLAGCRPAISAPEASSTQDRYPAIYRALRPSVVLFTMLIPPENPKKKKTWDDAYGSGLVVASGAWGTEILTDQHVIEGARNLKARIGDRDTFAATVVATDVKNDLALVHVSARNQRVARLGDSSNVEAGQAVGVIGYPTPDLFQGDGLENAASMYAGRISAVLKDALALDLPVIPGESGGPVFDAQSGTVIGIAESRFDEERAIGFATPVDVAKTFLRAHHARGF